VSEPLARLYDLALRTLDDQERRADALRSRLGPVLAAAALGVTLLSSPLVGSEPPASVAGKLALVVAVGSLFVVIAAGFRLLGARNHRIDELVSAGLTSELRREGLLAEEDAFYSTMIVRFADRAELNAGRIARLARSFSAMLWGIHVMLCGLALAALIG
jgi:hypothetical protein